MAALTSSTEKCYSYLFEAKSIQSYILATNRLKEIVGGSELVNQLTGKLLEDMLEIIDAQAKVSFSRRGGSAFYLFSKETEVIDRIMALWPVVVQKFAPDISFVQARGQGDNSKQAYKNAQPTLLAERNRPLVRFPQASPFAIRNRRTGEPASDHIPHKGTQEPVELATRCKLQFSRGIEVGKRFSPKAPWSAWPLNLSPEKESDEQKNSQERDFPFIEEKQTIALVHADGNGFGQLLLDLGEACATANKQPYQAIFYAFSKAISEATEQAACQATQTVLAPERRLCGVYPARPIVLGGDDLTILVRADLALPFTQCFLACFAKESEKKLLALKERYHFYKLPKRLTACAGIAYAKSSQPFHLLHELAEGLCAQAKRWAKGDHHSQGKEVPSTLSFHVVTSAFVADIEVILEQELTANGFRQSLECYAIDTGTGLPNIADLLVLQTLLQQPNMARGPLRRLLGIMSDQSTLAQRQYTRWREVMADRFSNDLQVFDDVLKKLAKIEKEDDLPFGPERAGLRYSPLRDAMVLSSVKNALIL